MKLDLMKIELIDIDKLIPADYNPRKISPKQMDDLKNSIIEFGITEPVVLNTHKSRMNIIISGHQRVEALKQMKFKQAPVFKVKLELEKEKELNVRMNKAGGTWDQAILESVDIFNREDLINWGFIEADFSEIDDIVNKHFEDSGEPVYPIVPEFSEKYGYVLIMATNEIDLAFLDNYFDVEVEQGYKNSKVGVGRVVQFEKFKKIIKHERVS